MTINRIKQTAPSAVDVSGSEICLRKKAATMDRSITKNNTALYNRTERLPFLFFIALIPKNKQHIILTARNTIAAGTIFIDAILSSIIGIVNYTSSKRSYSAGVYYEESDVFAEAFRMVRLVYIAFFEYVMPYI